MIPGVLDLSKITVLFDIRMKMEELPDSMENKSS